MTRMSLRLSLAVALPCACAKSSRDVAAEGGASFPSSIASVSAGSAQVDASSPAPASAPGLAWRGSYVSAASTVYIPADWKNVHWKATETSAGIGQGAMELRLDAATGRVSGTLDGPLGPATLTGMAFGERLTAAIARKDPADHGFVGMVTGSLSKDRAEGFLNVALWDASALRTGTFTLSYERER